ncbi:MAG: MFS transporter [Alphaproteobacteria bacterium]|nr:MFS transporter [Alphaproteobacteria bacterium]
MVRNIFNNYFSNKNYALLYGQNAFKGAAFLTMGLFIGGWLYELGVDLHWIILYQAANFTLMGLVSPVGAYMAGRYGITLTFGLSFACYFLSMISLSFAADNTNLILLGLVFSGLANGLQNPPDMVLHAVYIDNKNRGRAFSIVNCIATLMTLASILGAGWTADNLGLLGISFICGFFWLCSLICVAQMDDQLKGHEQVNVIETYGAVFSPENKNLLGLSFGFQFLIIGSFTFIPIILYISTESFQGVSVIAAMAIAVQLVILIMQGIWVDKTSSHSPLRIALLTHSIGMLFYIFFATNKLGLFLGDTLQRMGLLMFFGTIFPRVHKTVTDHKIPLLSFGAVWHMAICFWELIVLSLMALAVFIIGAKALSYCLLICAIGSFASYIYCRKFVDE